MGHSVYEINVRFQMKRDITIHYAKKST